MKQQEGFTLVELMVVMAIMACLVAFSLPLVADRSPPDGLSATLVAGLNQARLSAIGTNRESILEINATKRTLLFNGKPLDVAWPDNIILKTTSAKEDESDTSSVFRFFPNGNSTGGEIVLTAGRARHVIAISWLTGRITDETLP
jgi:general secretion pathway protein H